MTRSRWRKWFIALLTLGVVFIYTWRLMQLQIVDAEYYQGLLNAVTSNTQTIKAVRGEILTKDGVALAGNRMGYDVVLDKTYFPSDRASQNEVLYRLMELFDELGETWTDNLPLTEEAPFEFQDSQSSSVTRLKESLGLQVYADEDNVMEALVERYKLGEYSAADARKLAGVCYEMERRDFDIRIPYTFATDIDKSSVIRIMERSYEIPGVTVGESAVRVHDEGDFAPHIIGTVGPIYAEEYQQMKDEGKIYQEGAAVFDSKGYTMDDTVGKGGLEEAFEDILRGDNGYREIYVRAGGEVERAVEAQSPVPGNSVVLTLDPELQRVANKALPAQIEWLNNYAGPGQGKEAESGAVVAIKVGTGEVLAMTTYPSYNLESYQDDFSELITDDLAPLLNRAVQGTYAPGSIFKPSVAVAALDAGEISPTSTVYCGRYYNFYQGHTFTCMFSHGTLNVTRALTVSCNIFFYDVGRRIGIERINDTAAYLGLGQPTGIEVAEAVGSLSIPENKEAILGEPWYAGDVVQASIGQMLNYFTPLQLANYAATIANKGTRMEATLVHEVWDYSMSEVVQPFEPKVAAQMDVEEWVFDTVTNAMVQASHAANGTARGTFGNYPIQVASKTGTPETSDPNLLNSTFIAFAPADNPEIAVAVVIEKGYHGYTGAPVAKAIFDTYFGFEANAPNSNGWDQLRAREAAAAREQAAREAASAPEGGGEEESTPSTEGEGGGENSGLDGGSDPNEGEEG